MKFSLLRECGRRFCIPYKILLVMRLTFILMFAVLLQASAEGYAQKITLSKKSASLEQIFWEISSQSGYEFVYNAEMLKEAKLVDVKFTNTSLEKVLKECFTGQPLTYTIIRDMIIVKRKPQKAVTMEWFPVTGKVTDGKGNPLPGVTVRIKGSSMAVITNTNGEFILSEVKPGSILVFSYIGFAAQEISVNNQNTLTIIMKEDQQQLSELVVVGYGTQKKENLTGSVSSINGDELAKRPVQRASMALQGMASGVTVTQNTGRPGADNGTIRIRGIGTLGDSGPLVLIDGVQGNIDGVDPNDIESISVLKDAASAAIYGSRAANGVILVTTKGAKSDKLTMDYNGYVGRQVFTTLPEFVDGYTYMVKMNEAYANMNRSPIFSDEYLADYLRYKRIDPDKYPDTDWQKELYTGSGLAQHHYLSISGGKKVNIMSSFAYQDQQGIIPNYRQERYSFRLNAKMNIKDNLQSQVFINGRLSPTHAPASSSNVMSSVNRIPPNVPARLSDGRWGVALNGNNPVAQAAEGGLNQYDYEQLRTTFQLNYQPFTGADLELHFTPEYTGSHRTYFNKTIETYDPSMETPTYTVPARSTFIRGNVRTWEKTGRLIARYNKSFGSGHNVSFLGGYEQIAYRTENFRADREGYPLPDYQQLDAGSIENWSNGGTAAEWALLSYFGRINYNFKEKYLFEANIRIDGSSRFPDENKFGTFPSFSAGWRLSEENFLKDANWLSELKLRGSWGMLGNQEIGNYPFSSVVALGPSFVFGNTAVDGANQREMANTSISWESTETTNIGLDATFLNNKFNVNFDYYVRNTSGILLRLPVTVLIGLTEPYQNAGVVKNTGWDLSLNYRNRKGSLNYQVGFNLSDVKNEVVDLKGAGPIIDGYELIQEGYPINTLFGYQAIGLFQNTDQVNEYPVQGFTTYGPGDIIYQDVNDDKIINTEDRTSIGNQIPRYTFGLNLSAQYKGFDLSLLVQGVGEKNVLFTGDAVWALYNNGKMQTWQLDSWTPNNLNAAYPRLISESSHNNFQNSSFWVYNAAYARVKNLQIGYTLPAKLMSKLPVERLRIYATGDNVFTLHHMPKGWDPETRSGNAEIYPIASTYLFGLNITF